MNRSVAALCKSEVCFTAPKVESLLDLLFNQFFIHFCWWRVFADSICQVQRPPSAASKINCQDSIHFLRIEILPAGSVKWSYSSPEQIHDVLEEKTVIERISFLPLFCPSLPWQVHLHDLPLVQCSVHHPTPGLLHGPYCLTI